MFYGEDHFSRTDSGKLLREFARKNQSDGDFLLDDDELMGYLRDLRDDEEEEEYRGEVEPEIGRRPTPQAPTSPKTTPW